MEAWNDPFNVVKSSEDITSTVNQSLKQLLHRFRYVPLDLRDIEAISWHNDDGLLGGGLEMLDCRWIPI